MLGRVLPTWPAGPQAGAHLVDPVVVLGETRWTAKTGSRAQVAELHARDGHPARAAALLLEQARDAVAVGDCQSEAEAFRPAMLDARVLLLPYVLTDNRVSRSATTSRPHGECRRGTFSEVA